MSQRITVADAFTDVPFRGNPAAVCILDAPRDAAWMQRVAMEMNLSETAFLSREGDAWSLRWFTPAVEVDLCGHATLASAHVLWEEERAPRSETLRFRTRSGLLAAAFREGRIELDFPATPAEASAIPGRLAQALGAEPRWTGRTRFDLLVELDSEATVRGLRPDFRALPEARGVIVTARAASGAEGYDFVSRFFAPCAGIDEDPVTGSAHCALAPYWAERLGKTEMTGFQASARGGFVRVRAAGERVILGGAAVTVLRGELVAG